MVDVPHFQELIEVSSNEKPESMEEVEELELEDEGLEYEEQI